MSDPRVWHDVDAYLAGHLAPEDESLREARRASAEAGLPDIAVSPAQGKFLQLLAEIQGARRVLEIGTLGGYSTLWLARALPADGRLVTLEYEPRHAEVARANLDRAGYGDLVEVRVGPALESLAKLADENPEPFDLVFVDADKGNNPGYLEWSLRLTRPGSVIVIDNVVRDGRVADPAATTPDVTGTRTALETIASHPRLTGTALQTVGVKGHDGFALARVTG